MFAQRGSKVIGISDVTGGYVNRNGIDVSSAIAYAQEHHSLDGYQGGEHVTNAELLEVECDVLVPAALEKVLTAGKCRAHQRAADRRGRERPDDAGSRSHFAAQRHGDRIPDIIGNAGGVIVSYFEWVQDRQGYFWKESEVNERLEEQLLTNFRVVREVALARNIPYRTAAYMVAIDRVTKSIKTRGVYA